MEDSRTKQARDTCRSLREAAGLSQAAVGPVVGLSREQYCFVESGKIPASLEMYEQIKRAIVTLARARAESVANTASTTRFTVGALEPTVIL